MIYKLSDLIYNFTMFYGSIGCSGHMQAAQYRWHVLCVAVNRARQYCGGQDLESVFL